MRKYRFTFICNSIERELITALAHHLKRSQSDTIRFLINAAGQEVKLETEILSFESNQKKGVEIVK